MSKTVKAAKTSAEMTPDEREAEHLRGLVEAVEATKSGVLNRGKKSPPKPQVDEQETVVG